MEKIKNVINRLWNSYRSWLGDKIWYKNWKVWLSIFVVMAIVGTSEDVEEPKSEAAEPKVEIIAETERQDEKDLFEIDIKVTSIIEEDEKVYVEGETNLPDYAEIMIIVTAEEYTGQTKTIVKNGAFKTEGFTNKGSKLPQGEYDLSISLGIPSTQDDKFIKVVGNDYEYLTGDLIKESESGKSVSYSTTFEIQGSEDDEVEGEVVEEEIIEVTREQKNALRTAEDYLGYSGFSEKGLRSQLEYEEYPADAIDYAIENVVVDYNEEALETAHDYLDYSSFSDAGLKEQLLFEGFTEEQAQYAIDNLD